MRMSPRQQWFFSLLAVAAYALVLFFLVDRETMLLWTLIGLSIVSIRQMLIVSKEKIPTPEEVTNEEIKRLRSRLDRYRLSLTALPEGVILIRDGMTVEWCNPAAERHLGVNLNAHIGTKIFTAIKNANVRNYLYDGDFEHPLRISSLEPGRELLMQVVVADPKHVILLTKDITESRRNEAMRKDFVTNVNYELRNPIQVIEDALARLKNGNLEQSEKDRSFDSLEAEIKRLQRLVDDISTLSRLDHMDDNVSTPRESVDMPQLVKALYREAKTLSNGQHRFSLFVDTERGIKGCAEEIRMAGMNLISNAIRHTPENGEIEIGWSYDKTREVAVFSITDSGVGIAAEHIPRLTERFYRVDQTRSRTTGGTGLGLAIVKHVAMRHEAKLIIESTLGEGSKFCIEFPMTALTKPH